MSTPSVIGRYPVRRRIGSGAFATVWLAHDEQLDSHVAIKVLADNWAEDHHARGRFVEEGRFLRKVESPHVVSVYDAGELPDGRPFLVMSYADQGTLAERAGDEPLNLGQALRVIEQVGTGLHALHQRGVLHRDVKPGNVLFRTVELEGQPQVIAMLGDLGLGKAMDMSSRLTMIGGTPAYVAPEQAQGEPLDARADQFSLAALAYLLLSGRPAFDHSSLSAAADPAAPAPIGGDFGPEVDEVFRTALAKKPDDRYADVPAFVAALTATVGEHGLVDQPSARIPVDDTRTRADAVPMNGQGDDLEEQRSRRPWLPWLVAGVGALLVGLVAGWLAQHLLNRERTVSDPQRRVTVSVPKDWDVVDTGQWTPPGANSEFTAISAGTAAGWNATRSSGNGVFVGVLPGTTLPANVPQHPECETARGAVTDVKDGDQIVTVEFADCPGGVTVERVVQVTTNRLLWIQVRAEDAAEANDVLSSVQTPGM